MLPAIPQARSADLFGRSAAFWYEWGTNRGPSEQVRATRWSVYHHFILDTGNDGVYTSLWGQHPLAELKGRDLYNGSA